MTSPLAPGEPAAGPWEHITPGELARRVVRTAPDVVGRPLLVAVDGRGGGGKSTVAALLAAEIAGAVVVHTDDLAWNEPLFEWRHLMRDGVLVPLHAGRNVAFTPPEWPRHGRDGAVAVASDAPVVIVEGVGASEQAFDGLYDLTLWVQSATDLAEERGLARDRRERPDEDPAGLEDFWHVWMAVELPFLAADRPWERAAIIVAGNLGLAVPDGRVAVAPGHLTSSGGAPRR